MKQLIKSLLPKFGLDAHAGALTALKPPGSVARPIGRIDFFLQDLRARGFTPRGIVDIGANTGQWTVSARRVFPTARNIMIEPLAEMEVLLQQLAATIPGCVYVKAGAGAANGEMAQTITEQISGSTFLPAGDATQLAKGAQRLTPIVTLNDVLAKTPGFEPDLVKIDIQGYELEALKGGASCFGRTEVFILETSLFSFWPAQPTTRDCIEFMHQRGYDLYDLTEWLRRPSDGALGQVDLAFARRGGYLRRSNVW